MNSNPNRLIREFKTPPDTPISKLVLSEPGNLLPQLQFLTVSTPEKDAFGPPPCWTPKFGGMI